MNKILKTFFTLLLMASLHSGYAAENLDKDIDCDRVDNSTTPVDETVKCTKDGVEVDCTTEGAERVTSE